MDGLAGSAHELPELLAAIAAPDVVAGARDVGVVVVAEKHQFASGGAGGCAGSSGVVIIRYKHAPSGTVITLR